VRRLLRVTVGCILFALIAKVWFVQGLTAPFVVASGSMAPALLGPHRIWHCSACRHDFCCLAESLPAPGSMAVCSNCGARQAVEQGMDREGDRVLIDRSSFVWRAPRRWETIVFRDPRQATAWCVKRVVGLPGEVVEIRGGDVVVDGRVAAKDESTLQAMAISVHDAIPKDRRWQAMAGGSWEPGTHGALYRRLASPDTEIDWLTYRHEHDFQPGSAVDAAIVDESPVDQSESRILEPVTDLLLDCRLQATGDGEVLLRAGSTSDEFTANLDIRSGAGQLRQNGRILIGFTAEKDPLQSATRVEFILADQRVRLVLGGRIVAEHNYQPSAKPAAHVAAIGARGAGVEIRRLQIQRDVHYSDGPPSRGPKHRLGPNEYHVLGDNSPHALDSRAESFGRGISGDAIVGRAILWQTHRKRTEGQGSDVPL
jgi:signal peptidase I